MINHHDFSKLNVMKKNYFILYLLCFSCFGFAQKKNLNHANKLFANKAYIEAAEIYKQLEQSQEVLQKLSDCYYFNSQMVQAQIEYSKLFNTYKYSVSPITYFRYAHSSMGANDYKTADKIMSEYLGQKVNTEIFKEKLQKAVPYNYEIKEVDSGSNEGDFGISYYGNQVVFASLRNIDNPRYRWNNQPYLDLYKATVSEDKILESITPFSENINTKTHESNATFSKDGKTMYFSRTNDKRTQVGEEKYAVVKIYRAELIDDVWSNIQVMPFSSDTYSTQHPVLNKTNTKLFFSSDMPSTNGSFDIYYVNISDDNYSDPINLGNSINTLHREQFPYISEDNSLYFSSNGHKGFGGLDIFASQLIDTLYSKPLNLGTSINTGMDDFGFIVKDSIQEGFLSSNRTGVDKLYSFSRIENKRTYTVKGDVRDKHTKKLLPGTKITLMTIDGTIIDEMLVGEDATYVFNTEPNTVYKIEGYRSFYIPTIEGFDTNEDGEIEFNIELEIESYDDAEEIVVTKTDGYIYIELENIYFDLDKWDIKPQAAQILDILVDLLKKYPRMEIQLGAHTDSRSSDEYNIQLSLNRANSTLEYLVSNGINIDRLKSKGYGESQPLVLCGDNCTEDEHSINRRCEFKILK